MNWQTVYIFISSTFNDMHAERDHLVKQVFPQLRIWCAKRKLKLVDVDLRWGVSAADAQENKRVVEVCMKNIDKCRPFFLCFMGQRRGWVPEEKDINPETLRLFPMLKDYIGKASVTELEILHALMHPLSEGAIPVEHSRFYFRDKSYLKQINSKEHQDLFCPKRGILSKGDSDLEQFKKEVAKKYPVIDYSASWNASKASPELSGVLATGRLENFRTGKTSLSDDIIAWLKQEIALAYPDHTEVSPSLDPLDLELDRQATQLFQAYDGYIPRPYEEDALKGILNEQIDKPVLMLADAGSGKTSLLACIIQGYQDHAPLYYRFVGTTPDSFTIEDLATSLVRQWVRDGLLSEEDMDHTEGELALLFPNLIVKAAKSKPFTLILDGMEQLSGGFKAKYLPRTLPKYCHMIVSLRSDCPEIPTENVRVHQLGMMTEREDKIQMIKGYLNTFFKDVDDEQLEQILSMKGSSNPLYLKIVLNELRQHGSFDTLFEMLSTNYGSTPLQAFVQLFARIAREVKQLGVSEAFADLFFGCLAVAQAGINGDMFIYGARMLSNAGLETLSDADIRDQFNSLARELEPFFVFDGDKLSMRYNSMSRAYTETNASFLPTIHALNTGIFYDSATNEENTEHMKHALYHITHAVESFIYKFFSSADVVMWTLKHMGAAPLVKAFRTIGRTRNLADFEHLADLFAKAEARLDIYPETLFTELTRYGNAENPVVKSLLEQREKYEKPHFVPLYQAESQMILDREYALPEEKLYGFAFNDPYYIVYEGEQINVIDRRTNELTNILFKQETGFYGICRIAAGNDLLFVSYWGMGGLKDGFNYCECYTLPDLSFVSRIDKLCVDYTSPYELFVLDGMLYAYFNRPLGKFGDAEERRTEHSLVCISTNQVLFQEIFTGDGTHHVVGQHLTLYDHGSGNWQILRIKDGQVLVKEHFIGEDEQLARHPLAGAANLYAALAGNLLCLYMSGSNAEKVADTFRLTNEQQTLLYNVLEDGSLEKNTELPIPEVLKLSHIYDCCSEYFIAADNNSLTVYSKALEPLGMLKINGHPGLIRGFSRSVAETYDGRLLVFTKSSIQTYVLDRLIPALSKADTEKSHTKCDGLIRDGHFYVFGQKVQKYNLQTLEKTYSVSDPGIIQFICPWNIHDESNHCVTTAVNGKDYSFYYFVPDKYDCRSQADRTLCYKVKDPDKNVLLHAFSYKDENHSLVIANVVADKEPRTYSFKGRSYNFYRCRLLLFKELRPNGRLDWVEKDLDIEVMGNTPFEAGVKSIISDGKPYIVFPNVYVNDKRLRLSVYDIFQECLLYSHLNDSMIGDLQPSHLSCYEHGVATNYIEDEISYFVHVDFQKVKAFRDSNNICMFNQPIRDGYVYLHNPKSKKFFVYSLAEQASVTLFELTNHNHFDIQQILTVENMILVRTLMSDILEVYDFDSGEKLFDQRMEQQIEELFYDPKTKRLVALGIDQSVCVWEFKK